MYKVLVSDALSEEGLKLLKDHNEIDVTINTKLSPEELIQVIPEYDALLIRSGTKVTKEVIDAADKFFQELYESKKPFGGLLVIFGGDLRQTLPKMHLGTRPEIVNICFSRAKCFPLFKIYSMDQNMRL